MTSNSRAGKVNTAAQKVAFTDHSTCVTRDRHMLCCCSDE
jgi:hypothetical protein